MSVDYARYLAAKTTVDDRALNQPVLGELRRLMPARAPRLLEVGAGLGTMVARLLDWGLVSSGEYILLDADQRLLDGSRRWLGEWAAARGLRTEVLPDGLWVGNLRVRLVHAELASYLEEAGVVAGESGGGAEEPGGAAEERGGPGGPGGAAEAPGRPGEPGGPAEAPGRPGEPGGPAEAPGRPREPGGPAEAPGRPREPGGPAETPGRPREPGAAAEAPDGPDAPGGAAEAPDGPDAPGGAAEAPGEPSGPLVDVLIANAVLDLVDVPAVLPGLLRLLRPGGAYWFTINYDGETIFAPSHPLDDQIMRAYHRDMDERVRYGRPAGESRTGRRMFEYLAAAGAPALAAGSSDWVVHAGPERKYPGDEAYFVRCILDTIQGALRTRPDRVAPADLADWLTARDRQLAAGDLVYLAHQLDFTGRSPT
jgi:hypothetical protein